MSIAGWIRHIGYRSRLRQRGYRRTRFEFEGKKYVLEGFPRFGDHIMQIRPVPALKGTRTDYLRNPLAESSSAAALTTEPQLSRCQANVQFKVLSETYGRFCGIEVPEEYQRQGVGKGMVLALFSQFPGVMFHNTALNEKSGPFFKQLQAEHPENLAPIQESQISYWPIPGDIAK